MKKGYIKEIVLSLVAIFLIFIGYLNYDSGTIEVSARDIEENEITLGDVELVNTEPVAEENKIVSDLVPNDDENASDLKKEDYFAESKLERERMYSEMIAVYEEVISNDKTPDDQRAIAVQEINNITKIKNEIMISENLIRNKGIEEVIIFVNNENINVIVNENNLNEEKIAKIQNIISREFSANMQNINISSK